MVAETFFLDEEPSVSREELAHFIWGMVEGLEPETVDKSREEWLEVADRVRAMLGHDSSKA
jgi:hypothetical protein